MTQHRADNQKLAAARERRQRQYAEQIRADMKTLLSMPEGRRVLWDLIGDCGVFKESMETNARSYVQMGMRNLGLSLINRVTDADQEAYFQMMRESQARAKLAEDEDNAIIMGDALDDEFSGE